MQVISRWGVSPPGEPASTAEQACRLGAVEERVALPAGLQVEPDALLDELQAAPDALLDEPAERALPPVVPGEQAGPRAEPDGSAEALVLLPDAPQAEQADLLACLAALLDVSVAPRVGWMAGG